jgi:hypothetical protein
MERGKDGKMEIVDRLVRILSDRAWRRMMINLEVHQFDECEMGQSITETHSRKHHERIDGNGERIVLLLSVKPWQLLEQYLLDSGQQWLISIKWT